jgi:outer membrane receptor protein involved in Fe transport
MTSVLCLLFALLQPPSPAHTVSGVVTDITDTPLAGIDVVVTSGAEREVARTDAQGAWTAVLTPGATTASVHVEVAGFAPMTRSVDVPSSSLRLELRPQAIAEKVTVTAETSVTRLSIDSSVTSIDRSSIAVAPALRLDDQLRAVPGFSLFRRTSSSVANPTTQGVTLRGLSASGASRTLVVADDVPLNDPFGAWVYWDRIPMAALQRVDVVRGASGDVHGNDALGGVIRLTTRTTQGAEAWVDGGSERTGRASLYGAMTRGPWLGGAALERATTDGFIVIAPEARGSIDIAADSRSTSAMAWAGFTHGASAATLRGGYFTEQRGNGTPAQVNGTVTRWSGGNAHGIVAGGVWEARGDVSVNNYRQTFSAVAAARTSERLTNLQWVGSTGAGGGLSWIRQAHRAQLLVSGTSRLATANLDEASVSLAGVESAVTRTPGRQRDAGVILQGQFDVSPRVRIDAGARLEWWRLTNPGRLGLVHKTVFFEPRLGASMQIGSGRTLRVDWLSGFRTPTINELFRSFRVGNTTTQANPHLNSEKSWGPEVAFTMQRTRWTARAIGYATRLDGAIYNRTVSSTGSTIVRIRDNGNARTFGSELELEWRATRALALTTAWALNDSTFTSGELNGKRVPQVPRVGGTVGVRASLARFNAAANLRVLGAQFDDDVNAFRLDPGALVDGRVGWRWSRAELFGAIENALDTEIDTGKTPIRTVGSPRTARAGVRIGF